MPNLLDLIKTSLYIGFTGYGGPAILAHMKSIFVKKKGWVTEKDFMDGLSLAQILPGATGVTLMGYLGFRLKRFRGAFLLPAIFALPAFIFMTVLSWAYFQYGELPFVKTLFAGLGALVVALLVNAIRTLGRAVYPKWSWHNIRPAIISFVAFVALFKFKLNIIYVIGLSAFLGLTLFYKKIGITQPLDVKAEKSEALKWTDYLPIILLIATFTVFLFSPVKALMLTFMKIGMLAFGGGFTSIPLMQSEIVDKLHILSLTQFRDGIAMGQITPGPVLITATFVGFKTLGLFGAMGATFGIFLPSLIAVLFLAKFHSIVKDHPVTRSMIRGLLAGFIGLLFATTITFGLHSLISWQTWGIFILDLIILVGMKKDPLWAILASLLLSMLLLPL